MSDQYIDLPVVAGGSGTGTVTSVGLSVPAFLAVSGSPITTNGVLAVTLSGTALPILNGGTGQTTAANAINALLPSQTGNSGKFLTSNGSVTSWGTVSGGTPAGSNTWVQFNNSGSFGASQALLWTGTVLELGNGSASEYNLKIDGASASLDFNRAASTPSNPGLGRNKFFANAAGTWSGVNNSGGVVTYYFNGADLIIGGVDKDTLYIDSGGVVSPTNLLQWDNNNRELTLFTSGGGQGYNLTDNSGTGGFYSNSNGNFSLKGYNTLLLGTIGTPNLYLDHGTNSVNVTGSNQTDASSAFNFFAVDSGSKSTVAAIHGSLTEPQKLLTFYSYQNSSYVPALNVNKDSWIGSGTEAPAAQVEIISAPVYPPDPNGGVTVAFDFTGSGYTASGDGTNYNYQLYNYVLVNAAKVFSVNYNETSVVEGFNPSGLSASYEDQGVPYSGNGYNGDGTDYTFSLFALYNGKISLLSSDIDAGPIPSDGNEYSISFNWTQPTDGLQDGYVLVRNNDGLSTEGFSGGDTSFEDDNSSWSAYPGFAALTFDINVSWVAQLAVDGYRVLQTSNTTFDDINVGTESVVDSGAWSSGSTVTPNSYTPAALKVTGDIGLFGADPVPQQNTTGTTTGFTAGSGTTAHVDSTYTGNLGTTAYTMGDVVRALKKLGILAL